MRRFLLCLLFLPLATPSLAQVPVSILASDGNLYGSNGPNIGGFYSYNPVTGALKVLPPEVQSLVLCLERSDGTLLGLDTSSDAWQAVDLTLSGIATPIAQFPSTNGSSPVCPVLANDGNYYGTSTSGGNYSHGYIYQLTAAGKINVLYNFTGGTDGSGPTTPPIQASDGNLYWYNGYRFQRYSPVTGLTTTSLAYTFSGSPMEASDGKFYAPSYFDGVIQITPAGTATTIYAPLSEDNGVETGYLNHLYLTGNASQPLAAQLVYYYINSDPIDGCSGGGNYFPMVPLSLSGTAGAEYFSIGGDEYNTDGFASAYGDDYTLTSFLFGGNGNYYAAISDDTTSDTGETCSASYTDYNQTLTATGSAPITMSLSKTHVKPGGSATLTWAVNNAYSATLQQCFGFNNGVAGGKVALTGSTTISAPTAGTYVSSIVCGGTETGIATLTAGNAALSLNASASEVNQGANLTLTATVTNAGTPAPTGKVNFMVGSTVVGSATLVNAVANYTASTASVPLGTYTIVASYAGDANYGAVTSTSVTVTVLGKAASSITLTPASQSVVQGASISIFPTVTGTVTGGSPMGSVNFVVGSTVVGSATLNYVTSTSSDARFTASTASVAPGTYSVTANYGGGNGYLPSSSNAATVTIEAATQVTLTLSPNPVPADTSFTMSATVKGQDSPSGTVFFYANGTQEVASANVSGGVAKVTVPAGTLAAGTYSMIASYAGDSNNTAGTSPAVPLTVQ